MTRQVILVDDDPVQRRLLEACVVRMGYKPIACADGRAALDALRLVPAEHRPAAMVLDLAMPGLDGMAVMAEMRRTGLDLPVVVQTAQGSVETAVAAMRAGAFDFLVKPASPERLRAVVERAVRAWTAHARRSAEGRVAPLPDEAAAGAGMRSLLRQARRAASSTIPLLVEGETGVGKEWLASAIRLAGPRASKAFVAVNCAALPAALAESILFGHAKGAFTDAGEKRRGKFVEADGGTLFLDEVGELPPEVQAKLLRVVETGLVDPVGEAGPVRVDVRIVSATNRDLEAEVAAGRFRQDLFFRLNVLTLRVPPLRDRRDEIAPLARRFLAEFAATERPTDAVRFAPGLLEQLAAFGWPGNIRQLENAVHRAVVLAQDAELRTSDFPQLFDAVAAHPPAAPAQAEQEPTRSTQAVAPRDDAPAIALLDEAGQIRRMEAVEADLIRHALLRYAGRPGEAARRLGIGRSTLYRKMRDHDLGEA